MPTRASRSKAKLRGAINVRADKDSLISDAPALTPLRIALLIFLASFLAYANSLAGEFVFDDADQIVENQNIRSWDNLAKAFTTHVWAFRERSDTLDAPPPLPYYRPLFTVMLTAEYHLFGLWPQGWHLVSVVLHILCGIGVFYVILMLSKRRIVALFAALVFALHPVHAESVSWISGMTDPLFGVFFLASFYFYLKARAAQTSVCEQHSKDAGQTRVCANSRRALALSLAMFAVSTFAKETALALVLLVFGFELTVASGAIIQRAIKAAKRALPYAAVALIYLVPRFLVLGEMMWKNPQAPDRPLGYTLLTLPFVVVTYLGHLVWPIGLSVSYNTHFITSASSWEFFVPGGFLGLLAAALVYYRRRISREVWQALLLIFVPLIPVLNLGQVSREEYLVFDHYLYLSVAGFGYFIALAICEFGAFRSSERTRIARLRRHAVSVALIAVIAVMLALLTAQGNKSWANSFAVWSNVARVRPAYWAAHYNTGLALLDAKHFDEARSALERAAVLKADEPEIFDALGRAFDGRGDTAQAVVSFKRAIEMNPKLFQSYNNLGATYFKTGDYAQAEANFSAALRLRPEASTSRFNLGLCYSRQRRYSDAARELAQAIQTSNDAEMYYELGIACEGAGRSSDALRAFQMASSLAKSQELVSKIDESLSRLRKEN
ncbi:MAG TPA: tetratricopeptide repeat protein [Blastocatellia bacterium]